MISRSEPDPRIRAYRDALAAAPDDMTALRALWAQDDADHAREHSDAVDVPCCARCGQTTIGAACDCAPEPARHEQDRLFTPAPEQMPGQTTISGLDPQ